jgi:uncharacterized protein
MTETVFLDSNIFMYAAGTPHPYKVACLHILSALETGDLKAAVNVEIFQELLYRYSHIKLADKGLQLCRDIFQYPLLILPVTEADMRLAIDLFDTHRAAGLKPRDAIHAATMQNNGISRVMSADREFDHLKSVTRIDPLTYTPIN